jgi:hypothetical protein
VSEQAETAAAIEARVSAIRAEKAEKAKKPAPAPWVWPGAFTAQQWNQLEDMLTVLFGDDEKRRRDFLEIATRKRSRKDLDAEGVLAALAEASRRIDLQNAESEALASEVDALL